jgi:Mrp family chromosome partitioning ATPase
MQLIPRDSNQNEDFADVRLAEQHQAAALQSARGGMGLHPMSNREAARRRRAAHLKTVLEESAQLKSRLIDLHKSKGLQSVVFAAATGGIGVPSVIMSLAKAFEKTSALRLLVIDANFKSPGISNYLGTRGFGKGLMDLLEEPESRNGVVQKVQGSSVYFMPHGLKRRAPQKLFNFMLLQNVLGELERLFDLILIDAPPLLAFPEGFLWGRIADGMIFVGHPQQTTKSQVRFVQGKCEEQNIELLGTVLNRRLHGIPEFVYEWF